MTYHRKLKAQPETVHNKLVKGEVIQLVQTYNQQLDEVSKFETTPEEFTANHSFTLRHGRYDYRFHLCSDGTLSLRAGERYVKDGKPHPQEESEMIYNGSQPLEALKALTLNYESKCSLEQRVEQLTVAVNALNRVHHTEFHVNWGHTIGSDWDEGGITWHNYGQTMEVCGDDYFQNKDRHYYHFEPDEQNPERFKIIFGLLGCFSSDPLRHEGTLEECIEFMRDDIKERYASHQAEYGGR